MHGAQFNIEKSNTSRLISEAVGQQYKESLNYLQYSL